MKNHFMEALANKDLRPKRKSWAPGNYSCKCKDCGKSFTGDKRAQMCADCAYKDAVGCDACGVSENLTSTDYGDVLCKDCIIR